MKKINLPSGEKLYYVAQAQFFRHSLLTNCLAIATSDLVRQKVYAQFKKLPNLISLPKAGQPFRFWSLDKIVNLWLPAPNGPTYVIVAVDSFSKWVEQGALPHLNSHKTAS